MGMDMSDTFTRRDRDRLRSLVLSYGADPARWPEADRDLARDPAWRNLPELQVALEEAGRTDGLLAATFGAEAVPEPSALLRARVLSQIPQMTPAGANRNANVTRKTAWVQRFSAAAACLMVGLTGGAALGSVAVAEELDAALAYASLEAGQDWLEGEMTSVTERLGEDVP